MDVAEEDDDKVELEATEDVLDDIVEDVVVFDIVTVVDAELDEMLVNEPFDRGRLLEIVEPPLVLDESVAADEIEKDPTNAVISRQARAKTKTSFL